MFDSDMQTHALYLVVVVAKIIKTLNKTNIHNMFDFIQIYSFYQCFIIKKKKKQQSGENTTPDQQLQNILPTVYDHNHMFYSV